MKWLFTCEHGGNDVPKPFQALFTHQKTLLESHRGYDKGALELFESMKAGLADASFHSTTTRLLADLNRSEHHPDLFSEITRGLSDEAKMDILRRYWRPHRQDVERQVAAWARRDLVVHIAVHSFTPVLDGETRTADVGLLFDPKRPGEKSLCDAWKRALAKEKTGLRLKFNYPYKGTADGLTTHLRALNRPDKYIGIELEVNQDKLKGSKTALQRRYAAITASLRAAAAHIATQ